MSPSGAQVLLNSKHNAGSTLSSSAKATIRPRTRVVTSARLEVPPRPSNGISEDSQQTDAFKELVAFSKKQSVNRVQDVGLRLTSCK